MKKKINVQYFIQYTSFFALSKIVTFITPLLISNEINRRLYGLLEYNISLALWFTPLLLVGAGNSYAYFKLKKNEIRKSSQAIWHLLIVYLLMWVLILGVDLLLVAVILTVIFQQFFSTYDQAEGNSHYAVFWSSFLYYSLLIYYLLVVCGLKLRLEVILISTSIIAVLFLLRTLRKTREKFHLFEYIEILKYGFSVIIVSFLLQIFTSGSRFFLEIFVNIEEVGIYSFYYRIASIAPLLIYQFLYLLFFKKLYLNDLKKIDAYYGIFLLSLLIISLFSFYIVPFLVKDYFAIFNETFYRYKAEYFLLILHTLLWIEFALLENLIYRENLSYKIIKSLLVISLMYVSSIWIAYNYFTISVLNFISLNLSFEIILLLYINYYINKHLVKFKYISGFNIVIVLTILLSILIIY